MAGLRSYAYEGVGVHNQETYRYSQAIRVGDIIQLAGQGGWDPATGEFKETIKGQLEQAFKNVELAIRTAGGKGWEQVYRVNSYHLELNEEVNLIFAALLKEYCPNHYPVWTCVGVTALGAPGMQIEVEVSAYDPEGAKKAAQE
ncbi:hypothetical protein IAT38_006403 [Cryptococcus sp. DSM 104549]